MSLCNNGSHIKGSVHLGCGTKTQDMKKQGTEDDSAFNLVDYVALQRSLRCGGVPPCLAAAVDEDAVGLWGCSCR